MNKLSIKTKKLLSYSRKNTVTIGIKKLKKEKGLRNT